MASLEEKVVRNERNQRKCNIIVAGYVPAKVPKKTTNGVSDYDYEFIMRDVCKLLGFENIFGNSWQFLFTTIYKILTMLKLLLINQITLLAINVCINFITQWAYMLFYTLNAFFSLDRTCHINWHFCYSLAQN